MILITPPTPSPVPGVALILVIWGAVVDWRYKRKGGKKSSKKDRLLFLAALGVVVAFFVVLGLVGSGDVAGIIGETIPPLAIVLFATWELARWRTRRKNPLPKSETAIKIQAPVPLSPSVTPPVEKSAEWRANAVQKFVKVKVEYDDNIRNIPATDVKVENGRLRIYDGDKLVGEFSQSKVENWSFETD